VNCELWHFVLGKEKWDLKDVLEEAIVLTGSWQKAMRFRCVGLMVRTHTEIA
jgi:hypothetical protein